MGSGGIVPQFLTSALDQLHAPAALPTEKESQYPLDRRLGGSQSRFQPCELVKNLFPLPGIETGRPAHTLSRLTHIRM
jgi:hypothetical protein